MEVCPNPVIIMALPAAYFKCFYLGDKLYRYDFQQFFLPGNQQPWPARLHNAAKKT